MEITAIEGQKKNKERVSLFLDEKFWLGLSLDLFEELGLRKGMIIDDKKKEEIERLAQEDKAFYSALRSLSYKDYSEAEIRRKLKEKDYPDKAIEKAVSRCLSLGLIDDLAYAEIVAANKKSGGQGKRRVEEYLRQAGIAAEKIRPLLEENFPEDEEADEAQRVLERKYSQKLNPDEAQKAHNFLLRRGFSFSAASQAVARKKMSEEEQESYWGYEQALEKLKQRWPSEESFDQQKAWRFLMQKGFSRNSTEAAIRLYSSSK